jgi:hypothetical protein
MRNYYYCLLGLILFCVHSVSTAQSNLLPHIGVTVQPQISDPICNIPIYTGDFENTGYHVGNPVADFTLYNASGVAFNLANILENGKPVLLIGGNYTCWRFRDQVNAINSLTSYYQDQIEVLVVYGVEAHPHLDNSPYSGNVWTGDRNFDEGVLVPQAATYGQRIEAFAEMQQSHTLLPEVLFDGPCNNWWLNFGPAPMNAYLIGTNGRVLFKHAWFNMLPDDMWCDLGDYFETTPPQCNTATNFGFFNITLDNGTETVYGDAGQVLTVHATIQNTSDAENVVVEIMRENVDVPNGWLTSLCVDVCLNSNVSQTTAIIPPGYAQPFTFYFFTGEVPGVGSATVRFINGIEPWNQEVIEFIAVTDVSTGTSEILNTSLTIFPNPVSEVLTIKSNTSSPNAQFWISDLTGKQVLSGVLNSDFARIDVSDLPAGIYIVSQATGNLNQRFVKF